MGDGDGLKSSVRRLLGKTKNTSLHRAFAITVTLMTDRLHNICVVLYCSESMVHELEHWP
jgi:hypothetical protein